MTWACAGDELDISFATRHGTSSEMCFAWGRTGIARCPGIWVVTASPSAETGVFCTCRPVRFVALREGGDRSMEWKKQTNNAASVPSLNSRV